MYHNVSRRLRGASLLAGATLGLLLAASSLVEPSPPPPDGVAALVNGRPITMAAWDRAVAALSADTAEPASHELRRHALDRLIEEELLVQHALELGLAERDPRVRADLVAAVLALHVAQSAPVSEAELRSFYEREQGWFRRPDRLRVRALRFGAGSGGSEADAQGRERATAARARWLAGEYEAARRASDPLLAAIPDVPLTAADLAELLGPTPARAAAGLAVGDLSTPVRGADGYWVIEVLEREAGELPPFEQARAIVEAEHRRRGAEEGLRRLLELRRAQADVRVEPR